MVQFATAFPDREIVSTAWRQLTWSHFKVLTYLKDPLARDFYFEMCRIERWSVRALGDRIQSMLFERTALSKKPKELIKKELTALRETGELTPDLVMRDPYMLPFLGLADTYSERDLEAAILREIERNDRDAVQRDFDRALMTISICTRPCPSARLHTPPLCDRT
jgi:hypothetical protein